MLCKQCLEASWSGPPLKKLGGLKNNQNIFKFGTLNPFEISFSSSTRFETLMADAINFLGKIIVTCQALWRRLLPVSNDTIYSEGHSTTKAQKGGSSPLGSPCGLKKILLVAASRLSVSCFELLCKNRPAASKMNSSGTLEIISSSISTITNNFHREHTICNKLHDNRHCCIGLTVHTFKNFICYSIRNVHDYYDIFSNSLNTSFEPF